MSCDPLARVARSGRAFVMPTQSSASSGLATIWIPRCCSAMLFPFLFLSALWHSRGGLSLFSKAIPPGQTRWPRHIPGRLPTCVISRPNDRILQGIGLPAMPYRLVPAARLVRLHRVVTVTRLRHPAISNGPGCFYTFCGRATGENRPAMRLRKQIRGMNDPAAAASVAGPSPPTEASSHPFGQVK